MKELYKKINKIQEEIGKLVKKTDNPFHKSKYLEINDLTDALKPLLKEHDLMLVQPIEKGFVITKIIDLETEKEFISELELPNEPNPQKIGSCITYYRRFALKSMFCIQEVDDDGNKASVTPVKKEVKKEEIYTLTVKDLGKWNGKIYARDIVYVGDIAKTISKDQIDKLKTDKRYIKT